MKVKKIKETVRDFYYEHRIGIWVGIDTALVTSMAAVCYRLGWYKGIKDGSNVIGRMLFEEDPDTYVKTVKTLQAKVTKM